MEPKSFGRDTVISSTQLVQYDDDEDNEDKLDSSHSDHRAASREGIADLGGGGQSLDLHLDEQSHMAAQAEIGVLHGELGQNVGETNVGMDIDRCVEGEEHEVQDVSDGDVVLQDGDVGAGGDLASDEAMRVYCTYDTTDVAHGDLTTSSAQGAGEGVNEFGQEAELQDRGLEGVLEEAPGDQGGYITEGVGEENSGFSELQQTQLRAQILIYGDLIKGVLPEHNLMLTAFQDAPEAFGQESDRSNTGGWDWEQHWQVAALKQQSELERQAEEELAKDKGDVTMTEGEQLENALPETLEPGATPMSMGIAANVEEEPGSRKRKKGAGKTREKKATTTTTPRSRARARKGSAAPVTSPSTPTDPNLPTPCRLTFESSAAAGVASAISPTGTLAANVVERRDGLSRQSLHTDTANWVEQARVSFEEAMSAANSAQHESQLVNSQAPQIRVSGNEAKFASAADAVKVAASVAKAAADAAKVAYEAALQARLFVFEGVEGSSGRNFAASIRADKDGGAGGRRSAIAAAKEEARKRASGIPSAGKSNPQSTDAVLRAAKLMTEAAAEAGAVLAKGNAAPPSPIFTVAPFNLVSFGNEEAKSKSSERRGRPRKGDASVKSVAEPAVADQQLLKSPKDGKQSWKKGARRKGKDSLDAVASDSKISLKKTEETQIKQSPEKPIRRQLEQAMQTASNSTDARQKIVEASLVEVMNDEEGLRGGWFSALVLEVKAGQAFVQYDEILTDDGKTKLKEWFPLEGKLEGPEPGRPRIRLIITDDVAKEEGRQDKQRKRRRTATKDRVWTVGDRADAFVQDGWWEGIVKSFDEDENKVTIHFPGEGDTQTVKIKNLRPSLIWKDGRWEQWTRNGNTQPVKKDEDQSPKRQKAGISPKAQARKIRQKSDNEVKPSEEGKDSPRTTRRGKSLDPQRDSQPSPAVVNTRSSPRQKLPPKRKDGATKLASPESEVSTPNQVSIPVSTRTRSLPQDAVSSDKEPSKGRTPATGSASQKKSPLSQKLGKKNQSKENGETPPNRRNLRNSKEQTPSPVIGTPTTRQKAKAGASTQNQGSARV